MNIHFTDQKLFDLLKDISLCKFTVGSHMYSAENEFSDKDFLYIYIDSEENKSSFIWEHHQLQFKSDNTDFNFSSIKSYIRNILTGDATINFETLFSDEIQNTELKWLYEYRFDFINYNIIKSYLGLAKRDLKYFLKDTNNLKYHNKETAKKLYHFVRGVIFADALIKNNFNIKINNFSSNENSFNLKDIKNGSDNRYELIINYFEILMDNTRSELNKKLNEQTINKFMDVKKMKEIDEKLISFSNQYKNTNTINYDDLFYKALENGLTY